MERKLNIASVRALDLLRYNGLSGWRVGINARRKTVAETWHKEKVIWVSRFFISKATTEQFDGIVLHEIAHALLGPGFGHGDEFVELCKSISPSEEYAVPDSIIGIGKYRLTCPRCGVSGLLNSKRGRECVACSKNGESVQFIVEKNIIELKEW